MDSFPVPLLLTGALERDRERAFILYSTSAFWDAKWFQKELVSQLQLPFIAAVIRGVRYLTSRSCFEIPACRLPDVVPL